MEFLQIMLVMLLLLGIIIVLYAYITLKNEKKVETDTTKYDEMFNVLNITVDEAHKSLDTLNKLATEIFTELDSKYQELLVIYKLIDEKKEEIEIEKNKVDSQDKHIRQLNLDEIKLNPELYVVNDSKLYKKDAGINLEKNLQNTIKPNNKRDEVLALKKQGLEVEDIARKLSLGQREVKLIIDFSEGING